MSSMEPSLQPSFTFPSRTNLQNYAKGIIDLSSSTQRLLVKPKQNTDIDIQTSFQSVLTVPKTLDKDVIDVKSVIPVETPIYVQPGLAEGMTNLTRLTEADKTIMSVTSANNALKRGNYKAAEKLIGRPVTTEEMANRTLTPETRSSENDPTVKTGVMFNNIAFGAQVDRNSQFNFHQREKMLKEAEPFFVNEMAAHLGVSPTQVRMLKTSLNFSGDSVLGFRHGHPEARKIIYDQFLYAWRAMQHGKTPESIHMRREAEGEPIHSGQRAQRAAAQDRAQRAQERDGSHPHAGGQPDFYQDSHGNTFRNYSKVNGPWNASANEEMPGDLNQDEQKRENFPNPDLEFSGASFTPSEQMAMMSDVPIAPPMGVPLVTPAVLENVVVNAPLRPAGQAGVQADRTMQDDLNEAFRLRALRSANVPRPDEEMKFFPPDMVGNTNPPPARNDDEYLSRLMNERRRHLRVDDMEDDDWVDEEIDAGNPRMMGDGIGPHRRRRTMKRKRHTPYPQNDFVPDVDGFYPAGGVISGNLMKHTGRNAVPISAQIQVQNTHQWTETPLQDWVKHPNYQTENRTRPIPIAQNTGIPSRNRKVAFGNYMLDHHKLLSGGVLSVSHKSGKKVKGMPNIEISPGLKEVINAVCTGNKVNTKKLTPAERVQLKDLMHRSMAAVDLGADVNVPPTQQLSLILGEIEAGNDSPQLKSQLKKLLPALKRGKCISAEQCADISKHYL